MDLNFGKEYDDFRVEVTSWLQANWPPKGELAELPLAEFRVLRNLLSSWWPMLGGDGRWASLGPGEYDAVLGHFRCLVDNFGRVQQGLRRNTTNIETNASDHRIAFY